MDKDMVTTVLEKINQMPFPLEEMEMLQGFVDLVGTNDLAMLCAVCYLYGRYQAKAKQGNRNPE